MKKKLISVVGVATFCAVWEIISASGFIPRSYFPSLVNVFSVLTNEDSLFIIIQNLLITLGISLLGFFIATFIGIIIGIVIGKSDFLYNFLEPILETLRPLPSSAIIPIAILFLGYTWKMSVFVVVFGSIWPILISTIQGMKNIEPLLIDVTKLLKLRHKSALLYVYFPASLPYVLSGMRTSLAITLILSVTAEMLSGNSGIGFYILDMERAFKTDIMYCSIFIIGFTGYILNRIFLVFESYVMFWRPLKDSNR